MANTVVERENVVVFADLPNSRDVDLTHYVLLGSIVDLL